MDHSLLLRSAGVSDDAKVGFTLTWSSRKVGRSGVAKTAPIDGPEVTTAVTIPRAHVGGKLVLGAKIVLLEPGTVCNQFAPEEVGAVLWEDSCEVQLEGDAPRLPVVMIPPGQPPFSASANPRWHIWINHEDLTLPVDVAVRINLNQANPMIADMIDGGNQDQSEILLTSLMLDLHRELVRRALLEIEDFNDSDLDGVGARFPMGSLGAAMESDLLVLGGDFEALRNRAKFSWAELDVDIQRLLNGEVADG